MGKIRGQGIPLCLWPKIKKAGIRPIAKQFFIGEYLLFYTGVLI